MKYSDTVKALGEEEDRTNLEVQEVLRCWVGSGGTYDTTKLLRKAYAAWTAARLAYDDERRIEERSALDHEEGAS